MYFRAFGVVQEGMWQTTTCGTVAENFNVTTLLAAITPSQHHHNGPVG
jgi:hypothetical protein